MGGEDLSGLSSAGGMQTLLAQKNAYSAKLSSLSSQTQESSTQTVSGAGGASTEVKTGGSTNKESEKSELETRLADVNSKITSMRTQEAKSAEKNKDKQAGGAQNPSAQNYQQPQKTEVASNTNSGTPGQGSQPSESPKIKASTASS